LELFIEQDFTVRPACRLLAAAENAEGSRKASRTTALPAAACLRPAAAAGALLPAVCHCALRCVHRIQLRLRWRWRPRLRWSCHQQSEESVVHLGATVPRLEEMLAHGALLLALAAAAPCVFAHEDSPHVTPITDRTFFDFKQKSKEAPWVMMFYAPWCSHCKALAPHYAEAAQRVKEKHGVNYLSFGKIDATSEQGVAALYEVTGYPTIKWMRDGHVRPFNGMRSPEGFMALAELLNGEPVAKIASDGDFGRFIKRSSIVYVLVTKGDPSMESRFARVGRRLADLNVFGQVSKGVAKTLKYGSKPLLEGVEWGGSTSSVLLRLEKEEPPRVCPGAPAPPVEVEAAGGSVAKGKMSAEERAEEAAVAHMVDWVLDMRFPTVSTLTKENFFEVSRGGKLMACVVVDAKKGYGAEVKKWQSALLPIARTGGAGLTQEQRVQFNFGVLDGSEEQADEYLAAFGIPMTEEKQLELPKFIVFDFRKKSDESYYYEGLSQQEELLPFLQGVATGTVLAQYQGNYGAPERMWRKVKEPLPVLAQLDFLPRFTFTTIAAIVVVGYLIKCICLDDDEEEIEAMAMERLKQQRAKAAAAKAQAAAAAAAAAPDGKEAAASSTVAEAEGEATTTDATTAQASAEEPAKETANPAAKEAPKPALRRSTRTKQKRVDD
jgi:thiol-disulfide isomerase/thioredoxin